MSKSAGTKTVDIFVENDDPSVELLEFEIVVVELQFCLVIWPHCL